MKAPKPRRTPKQKIRTPHAQLAREAAEWDERKRTPAGFRDAPEAIPRAARSVAISIRMPGDLLELLKRFAGREGIGYQALIKSWLDDRLRAELAILKKAKKVAADNERGSGSGLEARGR
jgi:predicted DNA binding CopG/RHH family protein